MIDAIDAFPTKQPMRAKLGMTVALPALGIALLLYRNIGYGSQLTRTPRGLGVSTNQASTSTHVTAIT